MDFIFTPFEVAAVGIAAGDRRHDRPYAIVSISFFFVTLNGGMSRVSGRRAASAA